MTERRNHPERQFDRTRGARSGRKIKKQNRIVCLSCQRRNYWAAHRLRTSIAVYFRMCTGFLARPPWRCSRLLAHVVGRWLPACIVRPTKNVNVEVGLQRRSKVDLSGAPPLAECDKRSTLAPSLLYRTTVAPLPYNTWVGHGFSIGTRRSACVH
jgi:hypothetical protein